MNTAPRLAAAIVLTAIAGAATVWAGPLADGDPTKSKVDSRYLRVAEDTDGKVALEVALRRFMPADGEGPVVTLVGVAHIGDASYYRAVQDALEAHDLVLYESVMPRGAGGAGGDDDAMRRATTREALGFVASVLEAHHKEIGAYPDDLAGLRAFADERDPRLAKLLDRATVDGWGRPLAYARADDAGGTGDVPVGYLLWSYAADGRAGGGGVAADIEVDMRAGHTAFAWGSQDSLQGDLARALKLSFQLDAIDYSGANWVCSDMSIDQVERAMRERGSDFTLVESALGGTSVTARVAKFMLGVVKLGDMFTRGAVSDMLKVMLIEMLGDSAAVEASLEQAGAGFAQVIIDDRNQVVVDDLAAVLSGLPDNDDEPESIAIFYGAGHMPDLAERLRDQLGYVGHTGSWLRAIEVDVAKSSMTEVELRRMRLMVRRAMKQMR